MSPVLVSYIWYLGANEIIENEARTQLPAVLGPGEEISLRMRVVAPGRGRNLVLVVSLVQEGVAWFVKKGAPGLRLPVDLTSEDLTQAQDFLSDTRLSAFAQDISTTVTGLTLKPGQTAKIPVTLRNPGPDNWSPSGIAPITFSYRWLVGTEEDTLTTPRSFLPKPLIPGQSVSLDATVVAPAAPGQYTLRLSMVQEGIEWFVHAGGQPKDIPVIVSP
jgi:hypothetical protein